MSAIFSAARFSSRYFRRLVPKIGTTSLPLDRTHASLDPHTERDIRTAALTLQAGEPLRLRVFVDHSVVEVYANDRVWAYFVQHVLLR